MKRKFTVDEDTIYKCLPSLPKEFSYQVEKFSKLVWRVWLIHHTDYDYACGKEVKTIHSFIKSTGDVMKPTNCDKMSKDRVCHIANIPEHLNLTTITPKYTTLLSYYD